MVDGSLFINVDNARGAIRSQVFEAALTENAVMLRVPFRSPVNVDPRKINVSITSNGVSLTPDLALRCGIVRLRKQSTGYRFRTSRPLASAVANRGKLLSAVFSILGDWVRRGSPRIESDYDGHARDFWCVVDEIVPRVFGLPRPTQGLKDAALAGADPLLELLRVVGLSLKAQDQIPSEALSAVQLLRIAAEEGAQYDGRPIPIDNEAKLVAMAGVLGRRASGRFDGGLLMVDEFSVTQTKEFVRRNDRNSHQGTFESKRYRIALSAASGEQHQQQRFVEGSGKPPLS
jgi:hypothetical protein